MNANEKILKEEGGLTLEYAHSILGNLYGKILVALALCLIPSYSFGAVNPPWSTTFNCTAWDGTFCTMSCDGLYCNGSWADSSGNLEKITAAASNPAGGGGLGQRHFLGPGLNDNSAGIAIGFNTPQSDLWVRWYMRYQSGFNSLDLGMKILYFTDSAGSPFSYLVLYGDNWDIYEQTGDLKHHYSPNMGFLDIWGATSNGSWHAFEFHIKRETTSLSNNGVAQLWVDGTQVLNVNNADWGMAGRSAAGISKILVGSNHGALNNSQGMYQDFDDIAISNTGYIGPLSGVVDTLPPSISLNLPTSNSTVSGKAVSVSAAASDNIGVAGVQFKIDGVNLGPELNIPPYALTWDSTTATVGPHTITATARDTAGNVKTSGSVNVIMYISPPGNLIAR